MVRLARSAGFLFLPAAKNENLRADTIRPTIGQEHLLHFHGSKRLSGLEA